MRYAFIMRTTLDIDDELLLTVKQIAQERKQSAGTVVSSLLRDALQPKVFELDHRDGIPVLPRQGNRPEVTAALVNRLRDEDE